MVTRAPKDETINIIEVQRERVRFNVLGTSPLICNRVSQKAQRELLLPPGRKTAADKASSLKHDPIAEFRASPYIMPEGSNTLIGVTSAMFKAAMRTAALDLPGATASKVGRLIYVEGDYTEIYGEPKLLMSITRQADINHTPDVRTRAILPRWAARVDVSFVVPILKRPAVANLMAAAGITAGIGDWRVEKGKGNYGCFELVDDRDPDFLLLVKTEGRPVQQAALDHPEAYDQETKDLLDWYMATAQEKGFKPTRDGDGALTNEEVQDMGEMEEVEA